MRMRDVRAFSREAGFSLIEVLVASFFLLVILMGVLPMFHRSTVSNQMAYDNTRAATFARSEMENYFQAPFYDVGVNPRMTIPAGQTSLVIDEYFDPVSKTWLPGPAPAGTSYDWSRTITVRQFHISAIDNGVLDDSEVLAGSANAANVHMKQILIEVQRGSQQSLFGPPRKITLNVVRSN
ncbi:MAG: hypothetical protein ACE5GX_13460 [Thermoanaerobaculia bacterium]